MTERKLHCWEHAEVFVGEELVSMTCMMPRDHIQSEFDYHIFTFDSEIEVMFKPKKEVKR